MWDLRCGVVRGRGQKSEVGDQRTEDRGQDKFIRELEN
jgi:hypothetical protein